MTSNGYYSSKHRTEVMRSQKVPVCPINPCLCCYECSDGLADRQRHHLLPNDRSMDPYCRQPCCVAPCEFKCPPSRQTCSPEHNEDDEEAEKRHGHKPAIVKAPANCCALRSMPCDEYVCWLERYKTIRRKEYDLMAHGVVMGPYRAFPEYFPPCFDHDFKMRELYVRCCRPSCCP